MSYLGKRNGISAGLVSVASLSPSPQFTPSYLFGAGEQGVWYDPSDINLTWRRNLQTYSEDLTNAVYGTSNLNGTITADQTTAPDGTVTADKYIEDTATATRYLSGISYAYTNGTYTQSIYVKNASGSRYFGFIVPVTVISTGAANAIFDLATGTVTYTANSTATITSVGNGWYRCSNTYTTDTAATTRVQFRITNSSTSFPSYTGDGTSGFYVWGAQLELGSTASAYQPITDGVQDYYTYQAQPVMFQDSAGKTPVTAVEDPVGLILDKSKGLVLGAELVTNGDFSDGTTTGWSSGSATSTAAVVDGEMQVTATSTSGRQVTAITTVIGKTYKVSGIGRVISGTGSPGASLYQTTSAGSTTLGGNINNTTTNAALGLIFTATATTSYVSAIAIGNSGSIAAFDNISVKELPGNHATQATSASRPTLSARTNLLTKTEQFDDAAWAKTAVTVTANATTAPDGTLTAYKLVETAVSSTHRVGFTYTSLVGVSYVLTFYAKAAERTWLLIQNGVATGDPYACFDLVNGVIGTTSGSPSATITDAGNGWYRCSVTGTGDATADKLYAYVASADNTTSYAGDITKGIYIWGASLVPEDQADLPYQRVNTATDYDTVGFKPYLKFDGVDDSMATGSIDFSGGDKMSIFAGVRKLSDATGAVLVELSASTSLNAGSFVLSAPPVATASYQISSKGTTVGFALYTNALVAAPVTNVLSSVASIAQDICTLRVNASLAASNVADMGTGNYGNYPIYIGRRGGTTLPFSGHIYSLIVRGAQSTDAQIVAAETWVNGKTGAY